MATRYCKYKRRFVIVNEYNLDCWCAMYCDPKKICTATSCKTHVNRDLNPELKRQCRGCIHLTNKIKEQMKMEKNQNQK